MNSITGLGSSDQYSVTGTIKIGKMLDNISPTTVARLIKLGLLKATKMPGRGPTTPWRVTRAEIARFRELMRTGEIGQHLEAAE